VVVVEEVEDVVVVGVGDDWIRIWDCDGMDAMGWVGL